MVGEPEVVSINCGQVDRLHIHFGLGRELTICDLAPQDATTTCTTVVWNAPSAQQRQAAFDAAPHVKALQEADDDSLDTVLDAARSMGTALTAAAATDDTYVFEDNLEAVLATEAQCQSAIWDLVVLLFLQQGGRERYVAEPITAWACKHAKVLGYGIKADTCQHFRETLASFQQLGGHFNDSTFPRLLFWRLLQQCFAQGWFAQADALLSSHWLLDPSQNVPHDDLSREDRGLRALLQLVAALAEGMPRFSGAPGQQWTSFEEYYAARSRWLERVVLAKNCAASELEKHDPGAAVAPPDLNEVEATLGILAAGHVSLDEAAINRVAPSSFHLFLSVLLHMYPHVRLGPDLLTLLSWCETLRGGDEAGGAAAGGAPVLELCAAVVRAAVEVSGSRLLEACAASGVCGEWLMAHVALLLSRDARLSEQLRVHGADDLAMAAEADEQPPKLLQHNTMGIPEYFMLSYAAGMLTHRTGTWRAVLRCLEGCPTAGQVATEVVLQRWPAAAQGDVATCQHMQRFAQDVGLEGHAMSMARVLALAALRQGRLAEALELTPPSLRAASASLRPYVCALVLRHAASATALCSPDQDLECLSRCIDRFAEHEAALAEVVDQRRAASAAVPARFGARQSQRVEQGWQVASGYCALCRACQQAARSHGQPQGLLAQQGLSVRKPAQASKGRIRGLAVDLLRVAPPDLCAHVLNKLRPYLAADQGVFTATDLDGFVKWLAQCSRHGEAGLACLPTSEQARLREDLLSACVLTAVQ